jgi:hypothetical protein
MGSLATTPSFPRGFLLYLLCNRDTSIGLGFIFHLFREKFSGFPP